MPDKASLESALSELRGSMAVSAGQMTEVAREFRSHIDSALDGKPSSLMMLPTFVKQPTGQEHGHYITLDWGGTHYRLCFFDLLGEGTFNKVREEEFTFTEDQIAGDGTELFDTIAGCIKDLVKSDQSYSLGFIFSFPAHLEGIRCARLIKWTKGFHAKGVEGKDVAELLATAFTRCDLSNVTVGAVANDTVGAQVTATYLHKGKAASIGLILATGHNISLDLGGDIRNLESGNFSGVVAAQTGYDKQLERETHDPPVGRQLLEKMVSGKYLGEVARLIVADLASRTSLLRWQDAAAFGKPYAFKTENLSRIAVDQSAELQDIQRLLAELGIASSSLDERKALKEVAGLVASRSARLIAAELTGALQKLDPELQREHIIAVDGSLYAGYPGYSAMLEAGLRELLGDRAQRISFEFIKDASSVGAAIIAASAR